MIIHTQNRGPVSADGTLKVELSGRQKCEFVWRMRCRRELEEQRAKEAYFQRTLEGKTVGCML